MQVKNPYAVSAFGISGIIKVVSTIKFKDGAVILYVAKGDFLEKTWGICGPRYEVINGQKTLGIHKDNFDYIRKLSSLELELYWN